MRKTSIAIAAVLAVGTSAYASTLIDHGFESSQGFTVGNGISGWYGDAGNLGGSAGWYGQTYTNSTAGSTKATVSTAQSHSGQASLEIPKQSYYYNYAAIHFDEISSGTATATWWVYLDSNGTDNKNNANGLLLAALDRFDPDGAAYSGDTGTWGRGPGPRMYDLGNDYGGQVNSDTPHSINMYTGGSPAGVTVVGTDIAKAGVWNGYQVVMDIGNGSYDFLVNAGDTSWTQYLTGTLMYNQVGPTLIDTFQFYQLSGSNYFHNDSVNAYIDDFSIVLSPEPASLALLGLGGLAMLKRRRV